MSTALIELKARIKNTLFRRCIIIAIITFIAFMIVARLLSGVHWITDIIGGVLLSSGLVVIYYSIRNMRIKKG